MFVANFESHSRLCKTDPSVELETSRSGCMRLPHCQEVREKAAESLGMLARRQASNDLLPWRVGER